MVSAKAVSNGEMSDCNVSLKGLCHEMKYFLKVLRIKSLLSLYTLIVFKFFCCLVMEKLKDKVLACFYENSY